MSTIVPMILVVATAGLVFAAGWRMVSPQYRVWGGAASLLFFLLHPNLSAALRNASAWDAFYIMLFVCTWLWTEHFSLFMRSWILAGLFAMGLWIGSPFVLWGIIAMVPWVLFNLRPLPAVGSFLTVLFGGLFIFVATWGIGWLIKPELGRPVFTSWIRWTGVGVPPEMSLPWGLLALGAILGRLREMLQNRRSDASIFAAVLFIVTAILGTPALAAGLIALSAPLIGHILVKREFLFHRPVRWVIGVTAALTIVMAYALRKDPWQVTGAAILIAGIGSRLVYQNNRLPPLLAAQAVCVGAFLGEFLSVVLLLLPG